MTRAHALAIVSFVLIVWPILQSYWKKGRKRPDLEARLNEFHALADEVARNPDLGGSLVLFESPGFVRSHVTDEVFAKDDYEERCRRHSVALENVKAFRRRYNYLPITDSLEVPTKLTADLEASKSASLTTAGTISTALGAVVALVSGLTS